MKPSRAARNLVAVAAASAAMIALAPAPATAAELPPSDSMYAIATDEGLFESWQLLGLDPQTAQATMIGTSTTPVGVDLGLLQGAVDPDTGIGYFLSAGPVMATLVAVDLVSGESTPVGPTLYDPEDPGAGGPYLTALAIAPGGVAFGVSESDALYRIDLATGAVTEVASYTPHLHAFAYDPVTDAYYGIAFALGAVYRMDVSDGSTELVATVTFPDPAYDVVVSLQFDSAGALWVLANDDDGLADALYSFTFDDPTLDLSGVLNYEGTEFNSFSLLIARAPAPDPDPIVEPAEPSLPATGADVGVALGAVGLLVLVGIGLRARRTAH